MKYETIKATSLAEVKKALAKLIADKGTQGAAAAEMGMSGSMLGQVMAGYANPGRKMLDHFGLEARTVYTPKSKGE
jgi:hypothetical protein